MGLCETSNFSIFTFSCAGNLKVCTRSYSNCLSLMFEWKSLQGDDITLRYSILSSQVAKHIPTTPTQKHNLMIQWNLPERPPLLSRLTKILIGSSVSQIAISESSHKRPPPLSDHLSLTSRMVAYGRFHCCKIICTGRADSYLHGVKLGPLLFFCWMSD